MAIQFKIAETKLQKAEELIKSLRFCAEEIPQKSPELLNNQLKNLSEPTAQIVNHLLVVDQALSDLDKEIQMKAEDFHPNFILYVADTYSHIRERYNNLYDELQGLIHRFESNMTRGVAS